MNSHQYTGSYIRGNYNFSITGLAPRCSLRRIPATLLNLLFRGSPTRPSTYLSSKLSAQDVVLTKESLAIPVDPTYIPIWENTILGQSPKINPALDFFENQLPELLEEYRFALALVRPECLITDIIPEEDARHFINERVDFFLPAANIVIEIDGRQHEERVAKHKDRARDSVFKKHKITTYRLTTADLNSSSTLKEFGKRLRDQLSHNTLVQLYSTNIQKPFQEAEMSYITIFRLQVIIVEMVGRGMLSFDDAQWNIHLSCGLEDRISRLGFEDIFNWVEILAGKTNLPTLVLNGDKVDFKIDISIGKRWDEESFSETDIICRSDHFDYFPNGDPKGSTGADYFHSYNCKSEENFATERLDLNRLLFESFGYEAFNPGQIDIIENVLLGEDTIGILPTGGGKSLCYQLLGLLFSSLTLVVCPIKSLMRDQVDELNSIGFNRAACINSDTEPPEKEHILERVGRGKTRFLFVSPERFQISTFRDSIKHLHSLGLIGLVVIDEVHCMSEWGHDFRTAYLTLSHTIDDICPGVSKLCLTATASTRVLEDIQKEFRIVSENVKTLSMYERPNLHFIVQTCDPTAIAKDLVVKKIEAGSINTEHAAILFTSTVNGKFGAYKLFQDLQEATEGVGIGIFTGRKPKKYLAKDFDQEKLETQANFKSNKLSVLVATKAFGMGVNKRNVHTTIHVGLPQSVEALYQEAGRAGRDLTDSDCFVLFEKPSAQYKKQFFEYRDFESFRKIKTSRGQAGDLDTHHYFITQSIEKNEAVPETVRSILREMTRQTDGRCKIFAAEVTQNDHDAAGCVELALYRLYQIGVVQDWTVEDFSKGIYLVDRTFNEIWHHDDIVTGLTATNNLSNEVLASVESMDDWIDCIVKLAEIVVDHHMNTRVKSRINSLETLILFCDEYDQNEPEKFRQKIEGYFTIDEASNSLSDIVASELSTNEILKYLGAVPGAQSLLLSSETTMQNRLSPLRRYLESYPDSLALRLLNELLMVHLKKGSSCERLSSALLEYKDSIGKELFFPFFKTLSAAVQPSIWIKIEAAMFSSLEDIEELDTYARLLNSDAATTVLLEHLNNKFLTKVGELNELV